MATKKSTSFKLSPDAMRLIAELAKQYGISKTAVLEIAVRKLATTENIQ